MLSLGPVVVEATRAGVQSLTVCCFSPHWPQFDVSLLAVNTLELRTAVANNNNYCHAVWVSPVLTVRAWCCTMWRMPHPAEVGCARLTCQCPR